MRRDLVGLMVLVACAAAPAAAQEQGRDRWFNVFLQQSFPRQDTTNAQIDEINGMFGTGFDTWDDVVNLSLGLQLFWRVSPYLRMGAELDLSQGQIDGEETVDTLAGPARLKFIQRYSVFTSALLVAHVLPCPSCERVKPFILAAAGVGYEEDRTQLTLNNSFIYEQLVVENDGAFPVYTAGCGLDIPFAKGSDWYGIVGIAYYWGRLDHYVSAEGSLAPAPEVRADTDSTGPNYWLGVGRRF